MFLSAQTRAQLFVIIPCFLFFLAAGSIYKNLPSAQAESIAEIVPVVATPSPDPCPLPQNPEPESAPALPFEDLTYHGVFLTAYIGLGLITGGVFWSFFFQALIMGDNPAGQGGMVEALFKSKVQIELDALEQRLKSEIKERTLLLKKSLNAPAECQKKLLVISRPSNAPVQIPPPTNRRFQVAAARFEPGKAKSLATKPTLVEIPVDERAKSPPVKSPATKASPTVGVKHHKDVKVSPVCNQGMLLTPPSEETVPELTRDEVVHRLAEARVKKYRRVCVPVRGWVSLRQLATDFSITEEEIVAAMDHVTVSVDEVCKGDWHAADPSNYGLAVKA